MSRVHLTVDGDNRPPNSSCDEKGRSVEGRRDANTKIKKISFCVDLPHVTPADVPTTYTEMCGLASRIHGMTAQTSNSRVIPAS